MAPADASAPEGVQVAQSQAGFNQWKQQFRAKALRAGISPATFDLAFRNVRYNPDVVRRDRKQSEFTKSLWDYLDSAVSASRINNGRAGWNEWKQSLSAIEARYGVDAKVVVAIWGLESAYGSYTGDFKVIESFATLAYDGRRRKFAEEQLIAALKIVQSGDKHPDRILGSWAGAMGHTQFIPTSFQAYAVDFTGDGTRDIWYPPDALASTANYLAKHGWRKGHPWGLEVVLPAGFDYAQADQSNRQAVSTWNARGVRLTDGQPLPNYGEAAIIAPAGARGPTFAVFHNFRVIKRYNNATSYAIAVGHLGDRIAGGPDFRAKWPRGDQPLSRSEKVELQKRLTARGFSTRGVDGKIGPNTISAIRSYQRSAGLVPDGYASKQLLNRLR
ncbi:lytic murein transglycosylase [Rhodobacteraceae bacterium KN286]|uniref:Lytic murein transglycosylase n=2 Tax=Oceanomicrobium pacificus TaxID=2692916 RepID=A0A6B0U0T0_9RHOB|nr:lytic murein transglycosylase [Oceanomicrobium pacificus]